MWIYQASVGRLLNKREAAGEEDDDDQSQGAAEAADDEEDSEPGKRTPSTDSTEDFEMLEKSVDDLGKAKTTGSSQKQGKPTKRKSKKR